MKAVNEVPFVALLLRLNFLESRSRMPFFAEHPPAKVWVAGPRLPMMHRFGWTGPKASSNQAFAWFVWRERRPDELQIGHFDWGSEYADWTATYATRAPMMAAA